MGTRAKKREEAARAKFDKRAQVKSLGSLVLYEVNQGQVPLGQCGGEQLAAMGMKTSDIEPHVIEL